MWSNLLFAKEERKKKIQIGQEQRKTAGMYLPVLSLSHVPALLSLSHFCVTSTRKTNSMYFFLPLFSPLPSKDSTLLLARGITFLSLCQHCERACSCGPFPSPKGELRLCRRRRYAFSTCLALPLRSAFRIIPSCAEFFLFFLFV